MIFTKKKKALSFKNSQTPRDTKVPVVVVTALYLFITLWFNLISLLMTLLPIFLVLSPPSSVFVYIPPSLPDLLPHSVSLSFFYSLSFFSSVVWACCQLACVFFEWIPDEVGGAQWGEVWEELSERAREREREGGENWRSCEALHNACLSAAGRAQSSDTQGPAGQGAVPDHRHDLSRKGLRTHRQHRCTSVRCRGGSRASRGCLFICLTSVGIRERLRERLKWPLWTLR